MSTSALAGPCNLLLRLGSRCHSRSRARAGYPPRGGPPPPPPAAQRRRPAPRSRATACSPPRFWGRHPIGAPSLQPGPRKAWPRPRARVGSQVLRWPALVADRRLRERCRHRDRRRAGARLSTTRRRWWRRRLRLRTSFARPNARRMRTSPRAALIAGKET